MTREERREELLEMLTYQRPGRSVHESKFIARYLKPLKVRMDVFGNLVKVIKNPDGSKPTILWSCHTDTVHRTSGRQKVEQFDNYAYVTGKECLGADCTTGVWLMRHMILAKIPGVYIFHRDEEVGRKGSIWIAEHNKELLKGINHAIAFDRKGTESIITRQMSGICCSADFAKSLNTALGGGFKEDPTGSYTDTASYIRLIPECTNLSVGYLNQHSNNEIQDLTFSDYLLDQILEADFTQLVTKRDPTAVVTVTHQNWRRNYDAYYDDDEFGGGIYGGYGNAGRHQGVTRTPTTTQTTPKVKQTSVVATTRTRQSAEINSTLTNYEQLYDLVLEHPETVADLLDEFGVSPDEILKRIWGKDYLDHAA